MALSQAVRVGDDPSSGSTRGRERMAPLVRLPSRHPLAARAWVVGLAAVVVGYAGAGIPSYWGDEGASVLSAERSWPSLALELGRIDAVHGLYYALLHLWIAAFGAGEWSTRAPSAIAVGFLAAGTVVLGTRWFDARIGLLGGVLVAVLPRTTAMATEARSYALGAALAVWATVACTELIRRRVASRWWWAAYGAALALAATLFVYLLLLVPVHLALVEASRPARGIRWRWALAIVVALAGSVPILAAAAAQRHQLHFLAERGYASPDGVLVRQWFGSVPVAVPAWALVLGGVLATLASVRRGRRLPQGFVPAITWVVAPTAALLAVDAFVAPAYSPRYLSFATPAVALLVAVGAVACVEAAAAALRARRARGAASGGPAVVRVVGATVALVAAATVLPVYLHQRTEWAKDGGSDLRAVAAFVQAHARVGDAVVFDRTTKPSRRPRLAMHLYPQAFAGLEDVALRTPYATRAGIWDLTWPVADIAPTLDEPTVWALELPGAASQAPPDVVALEANGYRVVDRRTIHRTVVYHLEKG
ncbi:hypothetical protein ACGGZK_07710 [Agromyces sp. MMS24-K17]|uniref:glycosyltransferase family 39 protein n=1 Tax=Agromyces sp. MMS24-K17 TaxID=3372850 RepID=UPI00375516D1